MLHSMTGYGRSVVSRDGRELCLEMRSVNHRFLDLSIRVPRVVGFIEDDIRKGISERLNRGHIDVNVIYTNHRQDAKHVFADVALARSYQASIQELENALNLPEQNMLGAIISMPDVLCIEEGEEDQTAVRELLTEALAASIDQIEQMRVQEGMKLSADLLEKADQLEAIVDQVATRAPSVVDEYRAKLHTRLTALLNGELDESRFLTEVAVFADRVAVDEELVRLHSHIAQIHLLAAATEPVGRKLDFLAQELNRETNTIGSKAMDGEIGALVIEAKAIIEKIREQVQNIE